MIDAETKIHISDKRLRYAIYTAFHGRCFYSGRALTLDNMHVDHINPVANGGKDCISNYVLCSQTINSEKLDKFTNRFIDRVTEINLLLYVPKVLEVYNSLYTFSSEDGLITLDSVVKALNLKPSTKNKLKGKLYSKNAIIKQKYVTTSGKLSSCNMLFASPENIKSALDEMHIKYSHVL